MDEFDFTSDVKHFFTLDLKTQYLVSEKEKSAEKTLCFSIKIGNYYMHIIDFILEHGSPIFHHPWTWIG